MLAQKALAKFCGILSLRLFLPSSQIGQSNYLLVYSFFIWPTDNRETLYNGRMDDQAYSPMLLTLARSGAIDALTIDKGMADTITLNTRPGRGAETAAPRFVTSR
jgi:hypothetical protein